MDFLYLQPFFFAFFGTIIALLLFFQMPFFRVSRGKGEKKIYRLGGAVVVPIILLVLLTDPHLALPLPLWGFFVGAVLIFGYGLWDDLSELSWHAQFFFQVIIAILVFLFGARIAFVTNPFGGILSLHLEVSFLPSLLVGIIWFLLIMNVMNWLDGVDGLSGSVGAIALGTIALLSLTPEVNQPPIALIACVGLGGILGFLVFNIPPARILFGTVGSMFLGFLIAFLSVVAGTKIATALLVLSLPIADALWVIGERAIARRSIFEGDRRHLHHKLEDRGWSATKITVFYAGVTFVIAGIALFSNTLGKVVAIFLTFLFVFCILYLVSKPNLQRGALQ